jgi:hypothetical protein
MKCEQCSALIEDYLDGELSPSVTEQVGAHIAKCVGCAALTSEIRHEQQLYARYSREVDVTPALWAGVQARIAQEKPIRAEKQGRFAGFMEWLRAGSVAPRLSPRLAMALVLVAIGITVGVMSYLQSRNIQRNDQIANSGGPPAPEPAKDGDPETPKQPAPAPAPVGEEPEEKQPDRLAHRKSRPAVPDPDRLVREAEQKYQAAIGILERGLKDRRRHLDPETRAQFDIALAEIDQTIAATRAAVRRNPGDPIAVGYLVAAYSKKVDFLRDTARDHIEGN